jgi:hypothetical protein
MENKTHNIDPNCILTVNDTGIMRRIYCPFRALWIQNVRKSKLGFSLLVAEVVTDTRGELVNIIFDVPYHYIYFKILVSL